MNSLIMRIKMRHCLRELEKIWYDNNDTVIGNAIQKFTNTKGTLKVLKTLQAAGCVTLSYYDNSNRPYVIRPGEKSALYTLERSEIWFNRFLGFIAGVLSTVLADLIIRLL